MNTAQLQPKLNKGTYVDMYNIPKSSGKLQHICMCHLQHLRSTKALTQSSLGDKNNNKQLPKIRQKFPQQRGKSRRRENGESGKKVGGECTGEIHRLRAALNVSPQPIADVNTCMAPPKKKGNGWIPNTVTHFAPKNWQTFSRVGEFRKMLWFMPAFPAAHCVSNAFNYKMPKLSGEFVSISKYIRNHFVHCAACQLH